MSSSNSGFVSRNTRNHVTSRVRLRNHDYREPGAYFLTLCLEGRQCLLGAITDFSMTFTPAGTMVESCWAHIPVRHPTVDMLGYVIMPNHMHGIVILNPDEEGKIPQDAPSLSDIVQSFKQRTLRAYAKGVAEEGWPRYDRRLWQRGYIDHVIRNDNEMRKLTRYIETNIASWEDDTFHPLRRQG